MKKPVIGISGNEYKTGDHTEPLLSYTQTCLVQAIEDAADSHSSFLLQSLIWQNIISILLINSS